MAEKMGQRNRAVSKQDAFKAFQEACAGSLIPISSFIPSNFLLLLPLLHQTLLGQEMVVGEPQGVGNFREMEWMS